MKKDLPVIFLAFANEQHEGRYLSKIIEEYKQLYGILRAIASNESARSSEEMLCELVVRQNVTIGEIIDVFQNPLYKDRIAIFHYGGHADGYQLLLEGKDGQSQVAQGEGLVPLLGRRKSLKLVFLNGCSTQQLAHDLVERGVPAVIGTSASISDDTALMLSKRFYQGLAKGFTMAGAWEEAKDEVKMFKDPKKELRGIRRRDEQGGRFPWDVEFRDDAGKEVFDSWNLPDEADNPLFQLPKLPPAQLPASPFLFLKPYTGEHAEVFFGRSYYIRELWLKIVESNAPPLILLYGESGAGKSSLLDAGLRPRLEAATKDDDPASRLFEVRYQRRDQDRGLVGTLAEMLDYRPEEEPEKETPAPPAGQDPDLEKIEAIEALAGELEKEETRNSLQIYLDRHKESRVAKVRKRDAADLYQNGRLTESAGEKLREAWLSIEKETGRQLVVILDQVEELFTRPGEGMKQELEDLLQVLKDIFEKPADTETDKIRGRIILGYREEFNAKILARVKDYELARSTVFLEHLNEADIREVFQGLQRGKVGEYYGITVDEQLPPRIAGHLLRRLSAVAPVLQLLLTKLWKKTYDEKTDSAAFTVEAYNEIQSKREEMEEYFLTQMQKVREWNREVVETGLVLDILHHHVSDLGTSRRRHIREIDQRYKHLESEFGHPGGFVEKLVNKLKDPEIFLLNDEGHGHTSLPHDTLAPIIAREYHRSDKLGQRSARILDIKGPDLERAEQETDALKKLRLDENDLEIVQGGKKGMRNLRESERRLLEISLSEREKRLRLRRVLVRGGTVAGLFILFLTIMSGMLSVSVTEQLNQAIVNSAHEQSLTELNQPGEVDYYGALQLAQFAYKKSPVKRLDVVQNLHGILQNREAMSAINNQMYVDEEEFYYPEEDGAGNAPVGEPVVDQKPLTLTLRPEAKINSLDYQASLGLLASLEDGRLVYWPGGRPDRERIVDISAYTQEIQQAIEADPSLAKTLWTQVGFTADGKYLQMLVGLNAETLYLLDGKPVSSPGVLLSDPFTMEPLGFYDLFTGIFSDEEGNRYAPWEFYDYYSDLYEVAIGDTLVDTEELFYYQLWDEQRNVLRKADYLDLLARAWPVSNLPELSGEMLNSPEREVSLRATNLSRRTYNSCLVWNPENFSDEPISGFYEEYTTSYFSALSQNYILIVRPDGEAMIRDVAGETVRSFTMPAGAPNIGVSPDRNHFFAITRDSVLLWKLDGVPDTAYRHEGIRNYAFSANGSRLLTQSPAGVRVWSAGGQLKDFPRSGGDSVVVARFLGEDQLVIGAITEEAPGNFLQRLFRGKKKRRKVRIDYWNLQGGVLEESFEAPGGGLIDVAVSEEGTFAVAIQPVRPGEAKVPVGNIGLGAAKAGTGKSRRPEVRAMAVVIPSGEAKKELKKRDYNSNGIQPLRDGEGEAEATSSVYLSPGGKYIVRRSGANQIELFNLRGMPVNAFEIGDGFLPGGYDKELFTLDDHYLLTHKSDEAFFWHPEDDKIEWPVYDLDVYDKQYYGLVTFTDYIPGRTTDNKFLAIVVLLIALIFALLYFSDAIIRLVQQRQYLELGLYGAAFLLLSIMLAGLWSIGITEEGLIEVAFYSMVLATLGLVALGVIRQLGLGKRQTAAAFAVAGILLLAGTGVYLAGENNEIRKVNQETYLKDLRKDYRLNNFYSKGFYDSLYLSTTASIEGGAGNMKLSGAQLKQVAEKHRVDLASDYQDGEGWWLLFSALFIGIFLAGVGYPLYRAVQRYRAGRVSAFYRMLLWPLGFLLLLGWSVITAGEDSILILDILNMGAALILLGAVLRRGVMYYRQRRWSRFAVYGSLMGLSVLLLAEEGGLFVPALAAVFIEARQSYRRQSYGQAFSWAFAGLFLLFGTLALSIYWGWLALAGLLVLTPLIVLIFYGIRQQQQRIPVRQAAGKGVWMNRLAISGLWAAGVFIALMYMGALLEERYYEDDPYSYEEEGYLYEEVDEEAYEDFEAATAEEPLDEYAEAPFPQDSLPAEATLEEVEEAAFEETAGFTEEPAISDPAVTGEVDFDSPSLNNRQLLIVQLFDPGEDVRDDARRDLAAYWRGDRALIPELVHYNYENPDFNEGIWNTLYLLEIQPDELLREHRAVLLPYLAWVSEKGYGPSTMERVKALGDRVE